jgi:hypothetical protein
MTPKQIFQPLCPHCKSALSSVDRGRIKIHGKPQGGWLGFAYSCPSCHAILNVEIDPTEQGKAIVDAVQKALDPISKALNVLGAHVQDIGRKMR